MRLAQQQTTPPRPFWGNSHSSILAKCVQRFELEAILLLSQMAIITTTDSRVETQWICENDPVYVNGHLFEIDLICLLFKKIDVVLGMD